MANLLSDPKLPNSSKMFGLLLIVVGFFPFLRYLCVLWVFKAANIKGSA